MVSIVLPTYNEAETIREFLRDVIAAAGFLGQPCEILLLDDRSPDSTGKIVEEEFARCEMVRVIERVGPRGLGVSVREGLERSTGNAVVVMDADFNHDPRLIPYMVRLLEVFDLVVGSRFATNGGMQEPIRQWGSAGLNAVARLALGTRVQDNLSGFFAIRREGLKTLPYDRIFWGYGDYFFRLLYFALSVPLRIVEMPVVYGRRRGGVSKTSLLRTSCRYLYEIARLRWSSWRHPEPQRARPAFLYEWPPKRGGGRENP
jgi:dolichol-phosphate mannosyltransferase